MIGVKSIGVRTPIIREGDDLVKIVCDSVLENIKDLHDRDVVGITESVVARSNGLYATVDEMAKSIKEFMGDNETVMLLNPIYSRNRFSMILKAFARAAKTVYIIMPNMDEVGNPSGVNQFTGVDIKAYYKDICTSEHANVMFFEDMAEFFQNVVPVSYTKFYCGLHDYNEHSYLNLTDICKDKCEYGVLGSNKATEEKVKLFPFGKMANNFVHKVQDEIFNRTGIKPEVMIYGDGCFKDPVGGIWEFADPVVSPAYTEGLEGTPNEIKIKAFADDQFKDLNGKDLTKAIQNEISNKDKNLVGNMSSQGTTPRRFVDLLGSLMDLTSGSGDKGTPIVVVQNYFTNYAS